MEMKLLNIVAVVNEGFSEKVMEIAKDNGAGGGTIIPANSSVTGDAMKLYGIGINPEKEIILILVPDTLVDGILDKLYDKLGNASEAAGVFFTLPVTHVSENILMQYQKKESNE
jgi:hypothetical protein